MLNYVGVQVAFLKITWRSFTEESLKKQLSDAILNLTFLINSKFDQTPTSWNIHEIDKLMI